MKEAKEKIEIIWQGLDQEGLPGMLFLKQGKFCCYSYVSKCGNLADLRSHMRGMSVENLEAAYLSELRFLTDKWRRWTPDISAEAYEYIRAGEALQAL